MNNSTANRAELFRTQVEAFLKRVVAESKVPGIALAMDIDGRRMFVSAGTMAVDDPRPLSSNTRFEIGCVMKTLVSVVALDLSAKGQLDLDAPINRYFPELARNAKGGILVRHLMSHTGGFSGIAYESDAAMADCDWKTFSELLQGSEQLFTPGTVFNYQHSESAMLGEIIKRLCGRSSVDLVQHMFFEPLHLSPGDAYRPMIELDSAGHRPDPETKQFARIVGEPRGPSDFWDSSVSKITLSLPELVKIANALMANQRGALKEPGASLPLTPTALLERQVIDLPTRLGSRLSETLPISQGLCLAGFRNGLLGHDSNTKGQMIGLRFDPVRRISLAIGINALVPRLRSMLIGSVLSSLYASPPESGKRRVVTDLKLTELPGRYRGSKGGQVDVSLEGDGIVLSIHGKDSATGRATAKLDNDGCLTVESPTVGIGLFRDPTSSIPCVMVGNRAFKQLSTRGGEEPTPERQLEEQLSSADAE